MEDLKEQIYCLYITEGKSQAKIAKILNLKRKTLEYWIGKWKFTRETVGRIPLDKISLKDPQFCYFLGLWIADGHINKQKNVIELSLKTDGYILQSIVDYLNPDLKVRIYYHKESKDAIYRINFRKDENLVNFLNQYNLDRVNKSFNASLPIPEDYDCAKMLLRGYIDGDGNVRGGLFRVFTASETLKNDLIKLVKKFFNYDLTSTFTKTRLSNGFTLTSRKDFLPNMIDIYQGFDNLRINRKKDSLKKEVYDIVHSHKMINYGSWGLTP